MGEHRGVKYYILPSPKQRLSEETSVGLTVNSNSDKMAGLAAEDPQLGDCSEEDIARRQKLTFLLQAGKRPVPPQGKRLLAVNAPARLTQQSPLALVAINHSRAQKEQQEQVVEQLHAFDIELAAKEFPHCDVYT